MTIEPYFSEEIDKAETLKDCDALSQQASRLKQLVDSFKI